MRRTILWHAVTGLVLSGLVTLSSGCRKELCYNHDEHAYSVKVDVTATWEYMIRTVTGMTSATWLRRADGWP